MHSSLEPECNGVPHEFAQHACARCILLNTPPSDVAAQQLLLIPPELGEFVVHLENVRVIVHALGLSHPVMSLTGLLRAWRDQGLRDRRSS